MNKIWKVSNKLNWAESFKKIFLNAELDNVGLIFDVENFGLHNGMNLSDYLKVDFEEFRDKKMNFGLSVNSSTICYDLDFDYFYFAFGTRNDLAVFEGIFKWDKEKNLAIGNQYGFKIEPKIQITKNDENILRRINIKMLDPSENILKIISSSEQSDFHLESVEQEDILGGNFYGYTYSLINEDGNSFWDTVRIITNKGRYNYKVFMRGKDHPLFVNNLFPIVENNKLFLNKKIPPFIVFVRLKNDEELYYKNLKEDYIVFGEDIKEVCVTDILSFDWIIKKT